MDDDTLTQLTDAANLRLAALWQDLEIALPAPRITRAMAHCVVEALPTAQPVAPATNAVVERESSERATVPPPDPDPEPPQPPRRRPHSPETRQKLREAAQARMARPGERERMAEVARAGAAAKRQREADAAQPAAPFRNGDAEHAAGA